MQPSRTVGGSRWCGCGSPRASARGNPWGEEGEPGTGGMQPPPKGGGKPGGDGGGAAARCGCDAGVLKGGVEGWEKLGPCW